MSSTGVQRATIPLEEITMAVGSIVMHTSSREPREELGGPTMASWNQVKNIADPICPSGLPMPR